MESKTLCNTRTSRLKEEKPTALNNNSARSNRRSDKTANGRQPNYGESIIQNGARMESETLPTTPISRFQDEKSSNSSAYKMADVEDPRNSTWPSRSPALPGAFPVVPSAPIPASSFSESSNSFDSVTDLRNDTPSLLWSLPPSPTQLRMQDSSSNTASLQMAVAADLVDEERERQRDEAVAAINKMQRNIAVAETFHGLPRPYYNSHFKNKYIATAAACVVIIFVGVAVLAGVITHNNNNQAPADADTAGAADSNGNNASVESIPDTNRSKPCFQSTAEFREAASLFHSGNDHDHEKVLAKYGNPVGTWCVSNLTTFAGMDAFPGLLSRFDDDLSLWDTGKVTNMSWMFYDATVYNHMLSLWNTSSVQDLSNMFNIAVAYNQPMLLWNTHRVTTLRGMFYGARSFNQSLQFWNTSKVTDMSEMFFGAEAFDGLLSGWDVSNVVSMQSMFSGATSFDQDLSGWNLTHVSDLSLMFSGASGFNHSLCAWGNSISPLTNVTSMFSSTSCLTEEDPDLAAVPPGPFCHPCS